MASPLDSTTVPQGVDDAVGVAAPKWFVAIVNSRHEKAVADKLRHISIESYVATQQEIRIWNNGRRKKVDRVVIPSVVFVRCTEHERRNIVVALPYINRFLVNRTATPTNGLNRPPAIIADDEIKKLKFMLGQTERPVNFVPTSFRVHDTVRVVKGSLRGLQGQILSNSDGTHTLQVSIPMLGGAQMSIAPTEVEKINP